MFYFLLWCVFWNDIFFKVRFCGEWVVEYNYGWLIFEGWGIFVKY